MDVSGTDRSATLPNVTQLPPVDELDQWIVQLIYDGAKEIVWSAVTSPFRFIASAFSSPPLPSLADRVRLSPEKTRREILVKIQAGQEVTKEEADFFFKESLQEAAIEDVSSAIQNGCRPTWDGFFKLIQTPRLVEKQEGILALLIQHQEVSIHRRVRCIQMLVEANRSVRASLFLDQGVAVLRAMIEVALAYNDPSLIKFLIQRAVERNEIDYLESRMGVALINGETTLLQCLVDVLMERQVLTISVALFERALVDFRFKPEDYEWSPEERERNVALQSFIAQLKMVKEVRDLADDPLIDSLINAPDPLAHYQNRVQPGPAGTAYSTSVILALILRGELSLLQKLLPHIKRFKGDVLPILATYLSKHRDSDNATKYAQFYLGFLEKRGASVETLDGWKKGFQKAGIVIR